MSEKEIPDQELKAIEDALRSLSPRPNTADRDQLMFLAGQASALSVERREVPADSSVKLSARKWLWPTAAAAASMAAGILGLTVGLHVERPIVERPVERIVEVRVPFESPERTMSASHSRGASQEIAGDSTLTWTSGGRDHRRGVSTSYVTLRDQVLALGPDCIPTLPSSGKNGTNSASYLKLRSGRQPQAPLSPDHQDVPELKKGSNT